MKLSALTVSAFSLILLGGPAASLRADQTDDAIVAAMKLSQVANYSWTTTTTYASRTLTVHGETSADGYSKLTFAGYAAPASPASSTATVGGPGNGSSTNTVFLGDNKYVMETSSGWVAPSASSSSASSDEEPASAKSNTGRGGGGGGMRSRGNRGGMGGGMGGGGMGGGGTRNRSGSGAQKSSDTGSAGVKLPSAINLPHEELATIAANYTDLHFDNGVVSGKLTDLGAQLLLMPAGSVTDAPEGPAGTFRLWIADGAVTKYELKLTAEKAPGGTGVKGAFSETVTVELSDIGTTHIEVPDAAKKKLGV